MNSFEKNLAKNHKRLQVLKHQARIESDHECGFCHQVFPDVESLYRHQAKEHDPDGIMFSEIGLPK